MLGDSVSIVKELTPSLLEQLEQNILAPITSVRLGVSQVLTTSVSSSIAIWDSALSQSTSIRPQPDTHC